MNVYVLDFKIPANTPEDNPTTKTLEIEGVILERLRMLIPPGHVALARMAIFYGIKQIFPKEKGTWLRGDSESVNFIVSWRLPESKVQLTFKGWNEDDTYDHTFYLRLEVAEEIAEARPWRVIADFVAILKRLMGV